ncbi:unnamed protein product [Mytilus coruscus]|uniref:Uncharacterized protein n=1 Tax=Mytilus coruscus TaxID=42192 RepID=A0A6J8BQP4_MYTCO|nr:unnamed protein product [Mytilus coruscus]
MVLKNILKFSLMVKTHIERLRLHMTHQQTRSHANVPMDVVIVNIKLVKWRKNCAQLRTLSVIGQRQKQQVLPTQLGLYKKTALLQVENSYINTLLEGKKAPQAKESTIRKNLEEMMVNHMKLVSLDQKLKVFAEGNSDREKEVWEEMKHIMRKLKNAQEAPRKALQERLCQLGED